MFLFVNYNLYFLTLILTTAVTSFKDNKYNCIYKFLTQKGLEKVFKILLDSAIPITYIQL